MRIRRRWMRLVVRFGTIGVVLVVVAGLGSRAWSGDSPSSEVLASNVSVQPGFAPAIYAMQPTDVSAIRNGPAVQKAIDFLLRLQPTGTYVESRPGDSGIVPMDVAHAAIALAKVGYLPRARAAMTWLYGAMSLPTDDAYEASTGASYVGSWYDTLQPNGQPAPSASRGRGEAVGMSLIATYTIASEDPSFLNVKIGDSTIADRIKLSVNYLTQPVMQAPDGSFAHSPDYPVPFNEECARMSLGLRLASEMLGSSGDSVAAEAADVAATKGIAELQRRTGLNQGMAYDYYAMAIWGLATPQEAQSEIDWLKSAGLVTSNGVKNWDWQLRTPTSISSWFNWWTQAQTIAPSQTFDYAIASVAAGDVGTALDLEQRWLRVQRPDGGFDDAYLFGLRIGFSAPTSYAVSRFLLLERLLTDVVGSSGPIQSL